MKTTLWLPAVFILFSFSITAQELTMFTGLFGWQFYQDDKSITKTEFKRLLSEVPAAQQSWKRANINQGIALGFIGAQIATAVWAIENDRNDKNTALPLTALAGTGITSLYFSIRSIAHRRDAILFYNASFDRSWYLEPAREGVGLALRF